MKLLTLVTALLFLATSSSGQLPAAEKFIDEYAKSSKFNGTVLVKHGDKRLIKSFGTANFQFNIPNSTDTRFKIASITKMFTSVLIMQLCESGKLHLNETIRTYLPTYSGQGADKVTVYHLLTATSGIENSESKEDPNKMPSMFLKEYTSDQILQRYCSGKLENEPGKHWSYNNADYIILGKIIEAIYHKSFAQVLDEQLLRPLKMTNSGMCSVSNVIKGLASVYIINDSTQVIENDPFYYIENFYSAGAMYSTAEDLLRFSDALYGGQLLKDSTLQLMLTPYLASYGAGLWIRELDINKQKVTVAERQGSIWGTTTRWLYLPQEKVTIILLTNMYTTSLNKFQTEIMKVLLR